MRYDLHIHTHYSDCSINKPEHILKKAKLLGLNGVAITDHHTIEGAKIIEKLNKDSNFEVIIGEEITTEYGDILALYIQKAINTRKLFEVIDNGRAQDGILIIPHPFRLIPWLKFRYPIQKLIGKIDAVETINARNFGWANQIAEKKVSKLDVAKIGGSDAHIPWDIGKGYTLFDGDLRNAIKRKSTVAYGTTISSLVSGSISFVNKRVLAPLKLRKKWT